MDSVFLPASQLWMSDLEFPLRLQSIPDGICILPHLAMLTCPLFGRSVSTQSPSCLAIIRSADHFPPPATNNAALIPITSK